MAEIEKELRHYLDGGVEPRQMFEWSRETRAAMVDLKFCDLLGTWQHVSLPIGSFDESARASGSTAPRSAAGRGSPRAT
jgi:glutamine synthetase